EQSAAADGGPFIGFPSIMPSRPPLLSFVFFTYAFVFELQPKPVLTEAIVKEEFLKYYRGLCKAVLNGKLPDVDPSKFKLELKRVKSEAKDTQSPAPPTRYTGTLDWVEPFATKKPQKLNLEIQTWAKNDR